MTVQEQQLNFIKEIAELKERNPNHEIHFKTDVDGIDFDYGWAPGLIVSVKLGRWKETDSQTFDDWDSYFEHCYEYLEMSESASRVAANKMKKAIIVRIAG